MCVWVCVCVCVCVWIKCVVTAIENGMRASEMTEVIFSVGTSPFGQRGREVKEEAAKERDGRKECRIKKEKMESDRSRSDNCYYATSLGHCRYIQALWCNPPTVTCDRKTMYPHHQLTYVTANEKA